MGILSTLTYLPSNQEIELETTTPLIPFSEFKKESFKLINNGWGLDEIYHSNNPKEIDLNEFMNNLQTINSEILFDSIITEPISTDSASFSWVDGYLEEISESVLAKLIHNIGIKSFVEKDSTNLNIHPLKSIFHKETDNFSGKMFDMKNYIRHLAKSSISTEEYFEIFINLKALFKTHEDDHFPDGLENNFSIKLLAQIYEHGKLSLEIIQNFILGNKYSDNVLCEALKWIGLIEFQATHELRFQILKESIKNKSKFVRDSAGIGFSYLGDMRAIAEVEQAIISEKIPELKEDFILLLEDLRIN
jgi:hypothetical protein